MKHSREVVIALELAETTVPFARSRQGEAERWLRVLRRLERTGEALAALGVPDGPLESPAEARMAFESDPEVSIHDVASRAEMYARARGGDVVGTIDLLFGVLGTYGTGLLQGALQVRGAARAAARPPDDAGGRAPVGLPALELA